MYNYKYRVSKHIKIFPEVFWIFNNYLNISGNRLDGSETFEHPCLISHIKTNIINKCFVFIFTSYKHNCHKEIIKKKRIFLYKGHLDNNNCISIIDMRKGNIVSKINIKDEKYIKTIEPKEAMRFKNEYINYKEMLNENNR
jgi:hypothetical protein